VASGDPGPEDVEWLDGAQPHGRVRRVIERRLATRRGRAALAAMSAVVVTLAVTVAVLAWPDDPVPQAASAAQERAGTTTRSDVGETPPRSGDGHAPVVMWKVVRQIEDSSSLAPRFRVVNVATEPQRPVKIRLRGQFQDAPGLAFRARCRAPGRPTAGPFPVVPGSKVVVVCQDLTEYLGGREPRLDRSSLRVVPTKVPCESGGRGTSLS
jgi:hypothetical protein